MMKTRQLLLLFVLFPVALYGQQSPQEVLSRITKSIKEKDNTTFQSMFTNQGYLVNVGGRGGMSGKDFYQQATQQGWSLFFKEAVKEANGVSLIKTSVQAFSNNKELDEIYVVIVKTGEAYRLVGGTENIWEATLLYDKMRLNATPYPLEKDIRTLDGIITAYYEVVCGASGEPRQSERDASLHHPDASVIITGKDNDGKAYASPMTLAEFHTSIKESGYPAFYEYEISRKTQTFGNITHVWSTYAFSNSPNGEVLGRGINSIQLYHDGSRYWITSWIYDSERTDNPIPEEYLEK